MRRRQFFVGVSPLEMAVLAGFSVSWVVNVVVPVLIAFGFSFLQSNGLDVVFDLTLRAYARMFSHLGGEVVARTVRIAAMVTFVELLLAFPFALWLAKAAKNRVLKLATFVLLIVPFFMSPI